MWSLRANHGHGGGYQYRLCPAGSKLTEECEQNWARSVILSSPSCSAVVVVVVVAVVVVAVVVAVVVVVVVVVADPATQASHHVPPQTPFRCRVYAFSHSLMRLQIHRALTVNPIPGYVIEGWSCCKTWFEPPCGNVDIIFDHSSGISQLCAAPSRAVSGALIWLLCPCTINVC